MDTFPKGDKLSDLGIKNKRASPNFAFSVGYGCIVPRASQRPQNRRLKHLYKRIESRAFCFFMILLKMYNIHVIIKIGNNIKRLQLSGLGKSADFYDYDYNMRVLKTLFPLFDIKKNHEIVVW